MSFLSRFFAPNHPLVSLRKASSQGRWADVISYASELDESSLSASDQAEYRDLTEVASERLAGINFEEGLALLRADDFRRGMEHLDLARQLARSSQLRESIDAEFARIGNYNLSNKDLSNDAVSPRVGSSSHSCSSSCCGTSLGGTSDSTVLSDEFDEETRFELVLTAYPLELRPRYLELSKSMRQAILLAHEEKGDEARSLFSAVSESQRNDIFYFEFGSLLARQNCYVDAVKALQKALDLNPGYVLAVLTLVDLYVANKDYAPAQDLLSQLLRANYMPDYCLARFALINLEQGELDSAFEYAAKAIGLGYKDSDLMVFVARTLESRGQVEDAEAVLIAIPTGGGCSGGANVALADFWLRHKKNLQKSLEIFKNAAKNDPANPLWGYNIARVYLALGWRKEARQILETFVSAEVIDSSLRDNAILLLKGSA